MRRLPLVCLIAILCPALQWAGPIFGAIFFNGHALGRASISVTCNGGGGSGATLDDGSYRLNVQGAGRCSFTVSGGGLPGPATSSDVVASASAAQYNFVVLEEGGRFTLRRQ
jgi:hypothetical protein